MKLLAIRAWRISNRFGETTPRGVLLGQALLEGGDLKALPGPVRSDARVGQFRDGKG
jgi:hypothetical protein